MALAKITIICKSCGKEFQVRKSCYNSSAARQYEAWAQEHICECPECYAARTQAEELAGIDLSIALSGSEKQIAWAESLRIKYARACAKVIRKKDKENEAALLSALNSIIAEHTEARYWIDHREDTEEQIIAIVEAEMKRLREEEAKENITKEETSMKIISLKEIAPAKESSGFAMAHAAETFMRDTGIQKCSALEALRACPLGKDEAFKLAATKLCLILNPEFLDQSILAEFACRCVEHAIHADNNLHQRFADSIAYIRSFMAGKISKSDLEAAEEDVKRISEEMLAPYKDSLLSIRAQIDPIEATYHRLSDEEFKQFVAEYCMEHSLHAENDSEDYPEPAGYCCFAPLYEKEEIINACMEVVRHARDAILFNISILTKNPRAARNAALSASNLIGALAYRDTINQSGVPSSIIQENACEKEEIWQVEELIKMLDC